ncbi:MAG: hypothetical protein R3330_03350, partial [Saprospiraceae bacterium]|nr:hypothetical protein [Saprospiraceae bacterium]
VTVLPDATVSVAVDNAVVCIDGSVLLTATVNDGSGLLTLQWQSSPDSATWTNIPGQTGTTYSPPTNAAGTTYFRVVVSDTNSGCADPESNGVSVTVLEDATLTMTLDNAEVCIGGSATLTATLSNGSASLTLQWQSSPDNSTWSDIAGETGLTYNAPTGSVGTTWYRIVASDTLSGCADPASNSASVTVVEDVTASITVNNAIVCTDGIATLLATVNGGSSALQLQWQSSPDDATWTDIAGETGLTYNAPTSAAGVTYYRLVTQDTLSGCDDPASNSVSVMVLEDATVSINVDNAEVCVGGSVLLTSTVTNGSGSFSYQWQESPNNIAWANVDSATNATFYPPTGSAGTTYYRVIVTDALSGCSDPTSGSLSVTVVPDASVNVTVDNAEVCVDGDVELTANITGGSSALQIQWQSSPDDAAWTNIPGATDTTYTADTGTPGMTYYRAVITDTLSDCSDPVSGSVLVTVLPDATVSVAVDNAVVCIDGSVLLTATVNDGSGLLTLQWQSSPDSATWTNIPGQTGTTYSPPTNAAGTTYYRVVVSDTNSGCADPESNGVSVTVLEDATLTLSINNPEVCVDGDATLTATLNNGSPSLVLQWQSSPDDAAWTNIPGETGLVYFAPTTTPGISYYRVVASDTISGCADPVSNSVSVTVYEDMAASIAIDTAVVCVDGIVTITGTTSGGSPLAQLQWQSSPNDTTWTDIPGETNNIYQPPTSSAGQTFYRLVTSDPNSGCDSVISNTVLLTVIPDPVVTITPSVTELCVGFNATMTASVSGGTGPVTYQWQQNNSGTWVNVGANQPFYTTQTYTSAGVHNYRLLVTQGVGCEATSNVVTITVYGNPVVLASSAATTCSDQAIQLNAAGVAGSGAISGYTWSGPAGFASNTEDPVINPGDASYPPAGLHTYYVTVTDVNGCTDTDSTTIEVFENPTATATATSPLCDDGDIIFDGTIVAGSAAISSIAWSGPAGFSSNIEDPQIASADASFPGPGTHTYTLTVTDTNGCTATTTVQVTVNDNPAVTISTSTEVCGDESISLNANVT